MSNDTLNSLRKQLTFDFMLDFTVELTYEEVGPGFRNKLRDHPSDVVETSQILTGSELYVCEIEDDEILRQIFFEHHHPIRIGDHFVALKFKGVRSVAVVRGKRGVLAAGAEEHNGAEKKENSNCRREFRPGFSPLYPIPLAIRSRSRWL